MNLLIPAVDRGIRPAPGGGSIWIEQNHPIMLILHSFLPKIKHFAYFYGEITRFLHPFVPFSPIKVFGRENEIPPEKTR